MKHLADSTRGITLATLSSPMRALFTCFLLTIGIGYLAAVTYMFFVDIQPHQKMGMSVVDGIGMKYHGRQGTTRLEAALHGSMGDRGNAADRDAILAWVASGATTEGFATVKPLFDRDCVMCHSPKSGLPVPPLTSYEEVRKVTQVDTGSSFSQLARVSHIHLFGISFIFLLTGGIFALSEMAAKWRVLIITVPYLAIWADIGSWWVTKYYPVFAYVVLVGGGLMGLALAAQIFISLWEMWFKKRPATLDERGAAQ
ncbi:MAG: hypothetical protein ABIN37_07595 [Burkholderiaceae bacterium]